MSRGNLIALLLLVGLGAFFFLHDIHKPPADQDKRIFPNLEKKNVASLKVEKYGAPAFTHEFAKQNGVWVLQGPEPMVMRTASFGQSVKGLVEVKRGEDVGDKAADDEQAIEPDGQGVGVQAAFLCRGGSEAVRILYRRARHSLKRCCSLDAGRLPGTNGMKRVEGKDSRPVAETGRLVGSWG